MNDHREIPVRTSNTGSNYGSSNNNNPYVQISLVPTSPEAKNRSDFPIDYVLQITSFLVVLLLLSAMISDPNPMDTVRGAIRQAETLADNFWNHIRASPNLAGTAMGRIVQGTRVLAHGGPDKLFQQIFGILPGEKLLKSYTCYISTSSGPVIGTLYVSTKRLAFCSDHPLSHNPFSMQNRAMYYKVVVQLDQVSMVSPSTNRLNPKEKYIQLVTVDGYEFFFMRFLAYDNALKTINEALQQYHIPNHSRVNMSVQVLL